MAMFMEVRASAKCEWLGLESRIYNQDCALVICSGTGLGSCDKSWLSGDWVLPLHDVDADGEVDLDPQ